MPALAGSFEAHLTVDTDRGADFAALCTELGVDCVTIELTHGVHRAQPMTASHHRGELAVVVAEIAALQLRLESAGFVVVRAKIEAAADNPGVPLSTGYFEFHIKLRLVDGVSAIAHAHGARLSNNGQRGTRFVTMRVYGASREVAEAKLAALLEALAPFEIAGVAREYTVYDSRIELDAGWLEPV